MLRSQAGSRCLGRGPAGPEETPRPWAGLPEGAGAATPDAGPRSSARRVGLDGQPGPLRDPHGVSAGRVPAGARASPEARPTHYLLS